MTKYLPDDIVDIIKDLQDEVKSLSTRPIGSVVLTSGETITALNTDGTVAVIGDLRNVGEDRVGIAQFVGDTTPPPVPSKPIVSVSPGVFSITWDGQNKDNEPMAPDFDHFNIYGSSDGSTYLVGSLTNESEVSLYAGAEGGSVWTFYLTSVDTNRNESGPSDLTDPLTAINAGADPLVYNAIKDLQDALDQAEADALAANQAAQAAQNAADAAMAQALAGNIPALVIDNVAPTTPTDKMIWVDTSSDPYVAKAWDASTNSWGPVTDSTIAKLALAAAEAQRAADQASASADTAMQVAGQAQDSANGKNNVYYVPALPGGSNFVVGDTAFIRANVGDPITAQYQWDGTSWKSVTLNHQVISSVDLGKATVGALDGQYIKAQTVNAKHMVLQNTDNLINDPSIKFGTSTWNLTGWSNNQGTLTPTAGGTGVKYLPTPITPVAVSSGEWYSFSVDASVVGTGTLSITMNLEWKTPTGTVIYVDNNQPYTVLNATPSDSFIKVIMQPKKAPINAVSVVPKVSYTINASNTPKFKNLVLSKAMDAKLIVDGSVTADKVAAGSITSDKIEAGAITAGKIAANAVTADNILSGSITSDKITSGVISGKKFFGGEYTMQAIDSEKPIKTWNFETSLDGWSAVDNILDLSATQKAEGSKSARVQLRNTLLLDEENGSIGNLSYVEYPLPSQAVGKSLKVTMNIWGHRDRRNTNYADTINHPDGLPVDLWLLGIKNGISHTQPRSRTVQAISRPTNNGFGWWEVSAVVDVQPGQSFDSLRIIPFSEVLNQTEFNKPYYFDNVRLSYLDSGSIMKISMEDGVPGLRGYALDNTEAYELTYYGLQIGSSSVKSDQVTTNKLRLPNTTDASDSSTDHAFQIGPDNGVNLRMDNNEITSVNNGNLSGLYFDSTLIGFAGTNITWNKTNGISLEPNNVLSATSRDIGAIFTAQTNWTINSQTARMWGPFIAWRMTFTYSGTTAVTVPAHGNITNQNIATISNTVYRPLMDSPVTASHTGPGWAGTLASSGTLQMASIDPANTIAKGNQFSASGVFMAL